MMTSAAKRQADHYLPASLIGGFGIPSTKPKKAGLRYATVAVRRHGQTAKVALPRAEKVAQSVGEYWMDHPPQGLSPNFIDDYWKQYEGELPGAVQRVMDRTWTERDWEVIRMHIVGQAVRNPDFERVAAEYRKNKGDPIEHRDEMQVERIITLANTPALLARCRFAIMHTPEDGRRFIVNDKGFATVLDPYNGQRGVLFPLSSAVAVLCVPEVGGVAGRSDAWLSMDLTLTPAAVEAWNLASWQHKDSLLVVGHPADKGWIETLDDSQLTFPWLGPYRGRGVEGCFEWAYESRADQLLPPAGGPNT